MNTSTRIPIAAPRCSIFSFSLLTAVALCSCSDEAEPPCMEVFVPAQHCRMMHVFMGMLWLNCTASKLL